MIKSLLFVHSAHALFFESKTIIIPSTYDGVSTDSAHACDTLIAIADSENPGYSHKLTKRILTEHLDNQLLTASELVTTALKDIETNASSVVLKITDSSALDQWEISADVRGTAGYNLYHINESSLELFYESQRKIENNDNKVDRRHKVSENDVILAFSDGISDNLDQKNFELCFKNQITP
jgi:hypothetical protein